MDRRVARTRVLLETAHRALILERGYEAVSVEDICREADVGRSTFYAHYAGKADLKRRGLDHLRAELRDAARAEPHARCSFSRPMFEHAMRHRDLFHALAGQGAEIALAELRSILRDVIREDLARHHAEPVQGLPPAAAVEYVLGAFMGVLVWWLQNDAPCSPEQIDLAFRDLATAGQTDAGPTTGSRPG